MKKWLIPLSGLVLALVAATGCGEGTSPTVMPTTPPPSTPTPTVTGRLAADLRAAGASVGLGSSITQPFLSVVGQFLAVNGSELQVFEYPSPEDAKRDADQVSPDGSSVGTTMVTWVAPPHFYLRGTLIAIYVGEDEALKMLLVEVLGRPFACQDCPATKKVEVLNRDVPGSGVYAFDPKEFTFSVGDSVEFTVMAETEFHTFTVDELGIDEAVLGGETVTFTYTFEEAGEFTLFCIPHQSLGMVGTITVQ